MDVVESNIRGGERGQWGSGVTMNFVALTLQALTGPFSNIGVDLGPHVMGREQVLRHTYTRVRERMEEFKYLIAESGWDIRALATRTRNITNQQYVSSFQGYLCKLEGC